MSDSQPLSLPKPGEYQLRALSPTILELARINTKPPGSARVDSWDFVDVNNQLQIPLPQYFYVIVNGSSIAVQQVGFKRRPLYAPLKQRDLRISNFLYLKLAKDMPVFPLSKSIEVIDLTGQLWPASMRLSTTDDPLRNSPAIHVNQTGYMPLWPKKGMVGFYLGSLGEMDIPSAQGFKLIDAKSGTAVFFGQLTLRSDEGYIYTPTPYQKVYEADFSNYTVPGEYRLMVPGLGASMPFKIDDGVAMNFARAYALGLYHQRCGTDNVMPHTRFTHDHCHTNLVEVPSPQSNFAFTWATIASVSTDYANNSRHTAKQLKDESSQLYPFINREKLDVSGGHHDAGDYSKYTINSAGLIHSLMFAVDAFTGVADLDNLGLPESGDGISDLLQEAKWEADFLAKMQDADGGFYFLVYPRNRRYENDVLPEHGDAQVVWPKNTAVSAAAVAALAQCASSPAFKRHYPVEAALYLQKARQGWDFLTNAVTRQGKDGAYQKITHYGDNFMHDDELAWAACELYLATGEAHYQEKLFEWFPNPNDRSTYRWGWWRMSEGYGNAIRSYAFAARAGRLQLDQLNANYLAQCEAEIRSAGQDLAGFSRANAYGTSFPIETKRVRGAGWYFSNERAFDLAVAYQLEPTLELGSAMLENLNYEGGCNPVNVTYITGMGWKRQREIVHQYAQNDRRIMPPSGLPIGNIHASFDFLAPYGSELGALCYPSDGAGTAPYPFYDRWADSYNVTTEFVIVDQARSLATMALLAAISPLKTQTWTGASALITGLPAVVSTNAFVTVTLSAPGIDLTGARIVWEAQNQAPVLGSNFTFAPTSYGTQWVEAEAVLPDGRRLFAVTNLFATNGLPVISVTGKAGGVIEGQNSGEVFTFSRTGATDAALTVLYRFSGTATKFTDYRRPQGDMPEFLTIPAGASSAALELVGPNNYKVEGPKTITLTLLPGTDYNVGEARSGTVPLVDDDLGIIGLTRNLGGDLEITWTSVPGRVYRVTYKDSLVDSFWNEATSEIAAQEPTTSWMDTNAMFSLQRFYRIDFVR